VGQQHLQASKEKETTLQADKERNKVQEDALKGRALKLESQENDLKVRIGRLTQVRIPGA
jgi:hypothetical protein